MKIRKMKMIETKSIKSSKRHNVRRLMDLTQIVLLSHSIRENGMLQPIGVKPMADGTFQVVFGHRRFAAAKRIKMLAVPAFVFKEDDSELAQFQIVENCHRVDLEPLEEADAYRALAVTHELTIKEIAIRVGRAETHVHDRLNLSSAVSDLRAAVADGTMPLTAAMMIAKLGDDAQHEIVDLSRSFPGSRPTLAWVREQVKNQLTPLHDAPFRRADGSLTDAGPCTICPKRTGQQSALWVGIEDRKDVCLDIVCYRAKVAASFARAVQGMAKGAAVLERAEVFGSDWTPTGAAPPYSSGWLALDMPRPHFGGDPDGMKKRPTWREALGPSVIEKLTADIVEDGAGGPLEVVRAKDVLKAASKAKHPRLPELRGDLKRRTVRPTATQRKQESAVERRIEAEVRSEIALMCGKDIGLERLRAVATALCYAATESHRRLIAPAVGSGPDELIEDIQTGSSTGIMAAIVLCAPDLTAIASAFEIDLVGRIEAALAETPKPEPVKGEG